MAKVFGSVFGVCFLAYLIQAQRLPDNPCPELFSYHRQNGAYQGEMEFPNDYTGNYVLSVNMSVAAYLDDNENIDLEMVTSTVRLRNGEPASYIVHFPIQYAIPKPTRIEFNGRVYCTGPPEPVIPGAPGVTNMWAQITNGVGTVRRPSTSNNTRPYPERTRRPSTSNNTRPYPTRTRRPPSSASVTDYYYPQANFTRPFYQATPVINNTQPVFQPTAFPTRATVTQSIFAPLVPIDTNSIGRNPFLNGGPNLSGRQPSVGDQCGYTARDTQHLVFGGFKTNSEDYPWLTAIMYRLRSNYLFRCGGTLISDRHVVTAAHCVSYLNALLNPLEDWELVLGKHNIENWLNQAVIRDASNISVHPLYNQTADYDVAVITLSRPVVFDKTVRPACLWNEAESREAIVGLEGTVIGWGKDESGAESVTEAKGVVLPVVDQEECLRSNTGFIPLTSKRTFCAGRQDGVGPCTGDSGGGFVMNRNGRWTLRGIVSTSLALQDGRTCDVHSYFVFADVAKLTTWIRSVTG